MRIKKEFKWSKIIILTILVFCILSFHLTYCLAQDSKVNIRDKRDIYLKERGWVLGQSAVNPGGAYIGWAEGNIKLLPNDAKFGQARIMAFYRAFTVAKGEFVLFRQQEILTETTYEFFWDTLPEAQKEMDKKAQMWERISILTEKAIDLGEGYLDKLLIELNIDPDNYRKAEKSEKKRKFSEALGKATTEKAISSLAGVRVLETFMDLDEVGVLIVYNKKNEEIARQIAGGEALSRRPADIVASTIIEKLEDNYKNDIDYIYALGVRAMEDESGEIALVSFGQWAPEITKSTSTQLGQVSIQAARKQARSNAIADLTDFINSTMVFEDLSRIEEISEISRVTTDKRIEEETTYNVGNIIENIARQYGSAKLEGVTTIKEWTTDDPDTDHTIVGCVLMWSPSTRDAARGVVVPAEEAVEEKIIYDGEVRQSPPLDHLDPTLRP